MVLSNIFFQDRKISYDGPCNSGTFWCRIFYSDKRRILILLTFLSRSAKKLCGVPFNVSEKLAYRKISDLTMGYHNFLVKFFLSHSAENFRGEPLLVSEKFWYRKKVHIRRRYHSFLLKRFLSNSAKKFRGDPFIDSEKLRCRKTL